MSPWGGGVVSWWSGLGFGVRGLEGGLGRVARALVRLVVCLVLVFGSGFDTQWNDLVDYVRRVKRSIGIQTTINDVLLPSSAPNTMS
jgi:hypothetical protein